MQSLPSWERGLKRLTAICAYLQIKSLPSWERGLKPLGAEQKDADGNVAPFVGAWIETVQKRRPAFAGRLSLPSWERGLKQCGILISTEKRWSLPSWERGLKPALMSSIIVADGSLPSWERGLKLYTLNDCHVTNTRRSLRGSVD